MKGLLRFLIKALIMRAIWGPRRSRGKGKGRSKAPVALKRCRACRGLGRVKFKGQLLAGGPIVKGFRPCHTCPNMSGVIR